MPKYRSEEQFIEMCENMVNGNWNDAGKNCAEYGFFAGDIRKAYEEEKDERGYNLITDPLDFVELIQIAGKHR